MASGDGLAIAEYFSGITDPRIDRCKRHSLLNILVIAVCATVGGADNFVEIELWANKRLDWLRTFLDLPNGIPSHDTFGRVLAKLDPDELERCFTEAVAAAQELIKGEVVSIDGKTLRGSYDNYHGKSAVHTVSAFASESSVVLGQTAVADRSNEITAIPELLKMLYLKETIVTIDAMGCQRNIAEQILGSEADYVLAVKKNQEDLYERVKDIFDVGARYGFGDVEVSYTDTLGKDHGRVELRRCWVVTDPEFLKYADPKPQWPGLRALVKVSAERRINGKTSVQDRYYISSLPADATQLLAAVRAHWGIENKVHWSLDVTFKEDGSRVRSGNAATNLALLRRLALNLLKSEKSTKLSLACKRKEAAWDNDYLLKVLGN